MDIEAILMLVVGKFPIAAALAMVLGTLVVLAQVIIPLTPSKADDHAWEKLKGVPVLGSLLAALVKFAVIQKK